MNKRARRHRVVTYALGRHLMTQRRQSRRSPIHDDTLPENPTSAVLDDAVSSSRAGEGDMASPSHRAPSHTMLNDVVSHKLPRRDARWHSARKHLRSQVLDSLLRCHPGQTALARVIKHRARLCLTTSRRQGHNTPVLDDYIQPQHGRGWCLTAGGRRAPPTEVLDATAS